MALMATRQGDEALDIVQDSMLKLASRYSGRSPSEWAPLFYGILNNRITDWHRRSRVRNRLLVWFGRKDDENDPDPVETLVADQAPGPEAQLVQRHATARLEAALARLPDRQRQAFLLRMWEGLDVAGTAAAMGCSQGSVKTHLFRALATLRVELDDYWNEEQAS